VYDLSANSMRILGELFGIFQPSERFGLHSLPNKSPNFAKQCAKSRLNFAILFLGNDRF
jgi:hypothetical protein